MDTKLQVCSWKFHM